MPERLYSIVIPTRERADVLHFAIGTVLKLTRPNYELIVMDNCGSPETRNVVEAFASPRIRYFRAPGRLPMADNWEMGLEQALGDYVTFLGDDDGILPDALEIAGRFHDERPDRILSWLPFTWVWPDAVAEHHRNLAQMHFGREVVRFHSRDYLKDVLVSTRDWTGLPTLYCSFVPRPLLEARRGAQGGRYFLESLPDVFSGVANLLSTDEFFYSARPLTCWGISRHSTGAGEFYQAGDAGKRFEAERRASGADPWHDRVSGAELIVEVRIFDLYLKMKDRLFADDDELRIDMAALLRRVAGSAAARLADRRDEVRRAVEDMALKNGLDPADFPVASAPERALDRFGYDQFQEEPHLLKYYHFTDPARIRTIADFVEHAFAMTVPPERILIPPAESPGTSGGGGGLARRLARSLVHRLPRRRQTQ
jgi:glycosyltransferase involved in cell wall biosynthesis